MQLKPVNDKIVVRPIKEEDEHITEEMMEHWHKIDIEEELY